MKFITSKILLLLFTLLCLINCDYSSLKKETLPQKNPITNIPIKQKRTNIDPSGTIIQDRIVPPEGYHRKVSDKFTFIAYLQNLPLKPPSSEVQYYNGSIKRNDGGYVAVVDLPIGQKDLHQCADAVMHLRAAYLYEQKRYKDIHFNFTNGFQADYEKWRLGNRIRVSGNDVSWVSTATPSNSYQQFWEYLEMVFTYAGTYSLSQELKQVPSKEMKIGDVFIQGGFPGHAVIVVDMVTNKATGKQLFLLAQSYMPAQELHILSNPNDKQLSPWYELVEGEELRTPDWLFQEIDLKRFP